MVSSDLSFLSTEEHYKALMERLEIVSIHYTNTPNLLLADLKMAMQHIPNYKLTEDCTKLMRKLESSLNRAPINFDTLQYDIAALIQSKTSARYNIIQQQQHHPSCDSDHHQKILLTYTVWLSPVHDALRY